MKISVIIPTWNRIASLPRALDSVYRQTMPPHEVIVVDDGSTDSTLVYLSKHYPQVIVISQPNAGVSNARNTGIKAATGDWLALLDSDDEWLPLKLEKQVQALKFDATYRVCHTDEIWIRNGVRVNSGNKHQKYGGWIYDKCLPLCAMSPSSILLHQSIFSEYGLFDESLPACEDYDMWLRICAQEPVLYIEDFLLRKFGGHEDQLSRKYWGMDRFRMAALAKVIKSGSLSREQLELTRQQLAEKLKIYLQGARKRERFEHADDTEKCYLPLISDPG